MKAITIQQPRASLIAHGILRFECRPWIPRYRGPIAIHAASGGHGGSYTADNYHLLQYLWAGFRQTLELYYFPTELTFGAVVAVADLKAVYHAPDVRGHVGDLERACGSWHKDVALWWFENVCLLPQPIVTPGKMGLWEWMPPLGVTDG